MENNSTQQYHQVNYSKSTLLRRVEEEVKKICKNGSHMWICDIRLVCESDSIRWNLNRGATWKAMEKTYVDSV